jgi:hypothetical protein
MYLVTRSNSPFCGRQRITSEVCHTLLIEILIGSHYFVELVLSPNMSKTIGEIYIAIYSSYELLANVSMTHKCENHDRERKIELDSVPHTIDQTWILKQMMCFGMCSVSILI